MLALLCACSAPMLARAQTLFAAVQPIGDYSELFLRNPKVSGNFLVGLRWATALGSFDPEGVGIEIALPAASGPVCVELASKDGRYSAANLYDLSRVTTPIVRFVAKTKFGPQLRPYTVDEVAVVVRRANSCDGADTGVIPALVKPRGRSETPMMGRELTASVNADPEQAGIALIGPDNTVIQSGLCRATLGEVQIAFTTTCSLSVPATTTQTSAKLRLSVKERFKTVVTDYPLLLP